MASSPASTRPGLGATVALYTLARLGLLAAIALVLVLVGVPALIAVLVGLVVALPLSMVLFRGLRARLDEALTTSRQRRSVEREALRAKLRGDEPHAGVKPGSGVAAPDQPDRGQD